MSINRAFFLGLFILSTNFVNSQDFNNYSTITCTGEIPEDITKRASTKVSDGIKEGYDKTDRISTRKVKEEFILRSNYSLDELLTGGSVLFGDPITDYINDVADKVLFDNPDLRQKLRFYGLKSNTTNAFATHQGMIFITIGLISQLQTEAELAFIIAHEITHYIEEHSINQIVELDNTFTKNRAKSPSNIENNIIRMSNYSKALELEADSMGYYLLKNAGYDIDAASSVFDVLQYAHLPFNEMELDISAFQNETYTIPDDFILEEINPINFDVDEDDDKSTHPNLNLRREKINDLKNGEPMSGLKFSARSEAEFVNIRNIARFESIRYDLSSGNYIRSLYNAKFLLKKYPESYYLRNAEFKSLYGIAMYKLRKRYSSVAKSYKKYQGEISSLYHLMQLMDESTMAIQAMRLGWILLEEKEDDLTRKRMASLVEAYTEETNNKSEDVFAVIYSPYIVASEEDINDSSTETTDSTESKSKYDNIKELSKYYKINELKEKNTSSKGSEFNLLKDLENIAGFKKFFNENVFHEDYEFSGLSYHEKKKKKKELVKVENQIGASKIIVIDPEYYKIDERKGRKLEDSENGKYRFYKQIEEVSEASGLAIEMVSAKSIDQANSSAYNDISNTNNWVYEVYNHSKIRKDWNFVPADADHIKHLQAKYGTKYIAYTGALNYKDKKEGLISLLAVNAIFWYLTPYTLYYIASPERYSMYYTMVYDMDSNQKVIHNLSEVKYKAGETDINSMMYDLFIQMKKEPVNP
ncbi:MAG: hypothetical protein ACI9P5_004829 [Saprospiraceae bacterium]|jgi:hypothetical protein